MMTALVTQQLSATTMQETGESAYILGIAYEQGYEGTSQDYKKAVEWYMVAAEKGYAPAQVNLGVMYANGKGVTTDYKKAAKWYRSAAEQGNTTGQVNLGFAYSEGRGVIQDYKEANRWYMLSAEQGDARAQAHLGRMYILGHGVLQDYTRAYMWLNIAAYNGHDPELRDAVEKRLTKSQLEEGQKLAREWVEKHSH